MIEYLNNDNQNMQLNLGKFKVEFSTVPTYSNAHANVEMDFWDETPIESRVFPYHS